MIFKILRKMPDGMVELEDQKGRRMRAHLRICAECERSLPDFAFRMVFTMPVKNEPALCADCLASSENRRRLEIKLRSRIQSKENAKTAAERRCRALTAASPAWRDRKKIREVYEEARRLTMETGIQHHVDHHYPLQGVLCCGLHVHQNLKVMTAAENCSKSRSHPLDQSPALMMALS